jgi:acetoin utilization deacetylase AcuC-like enzyme
VKIVYSPKYEVDIGSHIFVMSKYRLTKDKLIQLGEFIAGDFIEPEPAGDADILLAHNRTYVDKLKTGTLTAQELNTLEIEYSPELVAAAWLWSGGSILAARLALETGACYHLGGGFHHAFPDHGEGFCFINDHAVAIRKLMAEKTIQRAMVIDCDVHQANGTAGIFGGDSGVFTFSIHQEHNYPARRPASNLDIGLPDETGDTLYLEKLDEGLKEALADFHPDLIFYVAGADPYQFDQIGGLGLTIEGLRQRDAMVFQAAKAMGLPVATVLAGGYAGNLDDLVDIHANTAIEQKRIMG